ncbi:MAG: hypothetical protein AAFU57_08130 [Bacteroidota bacterium]
MEKPYQLDDNGNIVAYDQNLDTGRFSFLSEEHTAFEKMVAKVNSLLNSMVLKKEHQIDWTDVVDQYKARGIGDVPHFASQYVQSKYLLTGKEKRSEVLEAMYLEITRSINQEIKEGNLPSRSSKP